MASPVTRQVGLEKRLLNHSLRHSCSSSRRLRSSGSRSSRAVIVLSVPVQVIAWKKTCRCEMTCNVCRVGLIRNLYSLTH